MALGHALVAVLDVEHSRAKLLGDAHADGRKVLGIVAGFVLFVDQHDVASLERLQDFVEAHARARLLLVRVGGAAGCSCTCHRRPGVRD